MACPCLDTAGFACAPVLVGFNPVSGRDLCFVTLWCRTWVLAEHVQLKAAFLLCASWGFSLGPLL